MLRRSPRFTVTALTLLVLGIGSTTAIFSIAYAVLVRPLPYPDAERLVFLAEKQGAGVAWPNFEDWRQRAHVVRRPRQLARRRGHRHERPAPAAIRISKRDGELLSRARRVAVSGPSLRRVRRAPGCRARPPWSATRSGCASSAASRPRSARRSPLNRKPFTVIGVLPPGFRYMTPADVYLLLEPQVAANYRGDAEPQHAHESLRRRPAEAGRQTSTAARAEMQNIAAALAQEYPATNKGSGVQLVPLADRVVRDMAPTLTVLAGAVTLLLLIACVNLASLLLNRSAARAHEFSIRAAIGGSRWSLIRQLLIEQALLVGTGGVLGALAGAAILTGLVSVAPPDMPRLDEIRLDSSCCRGRRCSVVPARSSSASCPRSRRPASAARDSCCGRAAARPAQHSLLRRGLMIGEIAVATVLLSGSGLMVHTMLRLSRVDPASIRTTCRPSCSRWPGRRGRTRESRCSSPQWSSAFARCPASRTPRSRIRCRFSARTGGTCS